MMIRSVCLAGALIAGTTCLGYAQSAVGGTGGSAAVGGTSASTIGAGATSTSPTTGQTSSTIGSAGSAAGGTRNTSDTKIHGNTNNLQGMSKARAQDGGTWSRSMTKTKVHKGEVSSRTKSMAHEPGGPPSKSTTTYNSGK